MLRCLNRMHETVAPRASRPGEVLLDGRDIYGRDVNVTAVRQHIGMVFQRPTPFPTMSIRDNVAAGLLDAAAGPPVAGARGRDRGDGRCGAPRSGMRSRIGCATAPSGCPAASSSGCASPARSRSSPRCCCSTSPRRRWIRLSTQKVEELVYELRRDMTVVIVTHNMQQAARVSDRTAFMLLGESGRGGADDDALHHAEGPADGGLHHRAVRMSATWPAPSAAAPAVGRLRTTQRRAARHARPPRDVLVLVRREAGALRHRSLNMPPRSITALIGPSGCGKSTFLRSINRMHDLLPGTRHTGEISLDGRDVYRCRTLDADGAAPAGRDGVPALELLSQIDLRQRRLRSAHQRHRVPRGARPDRGVRRFAARRLWDEVKDRLRQSRDWASPVDSSSGSVSPGRWRTTPRCCSSTSRPVRSTRSPRRRSKSCSTS